MKTKSARKRSFWRGIIASVVFGTLASYLGYYLIVFLAPTIFAAAAGGPFTRTLSIEWLLFQIYYGLVPALISGVAAARWSQHGSWLAPGVMTILFLMSSLIDGYDAKPPLAQAILVLGAPIGFMLGALAYRLWERHAGENKV